MTFGDLIGWVMRWFVGEKSGRASQRAEDVAAGQVEQIDALQTRAKVDDAVRSADDARRRRELRDWTLTIPRPDRKE